MNILAIKEAAAGYLYLNMPEEALSALEVLKDTDSVEVLDLVLAGQMMQENWNASVETSLRLCELRPGKARYFIHAAFCLHEVGDTHRAKQVLLSGPRKLKSNALFHYNMACYLAVLGEQSGAKQYLTRALDLDDSLKKIAMTDPDLKDVVTTA